MRRKNILRRLSTFLTVDNKNGEWTCDAIDLLLDIKFFMKEYYVAFFEDDNDRLIIKFKNGQKFRIFCRKILNHLWLYLSNARTNNHSI